MKKSKEKKFHNEHFLYFHPRTGYSTQKLKFEKKSKVWDRDLVFMGKDGAAARGVKGYFRK